MIPRGGVDMFNERLKEARTKKGLKGREMAELLGVSYSTYSKYESTERKPDIDMLARIADVLSVSTDYLLGRTDDPRLHIQEVETDRGVAELHVSKPLTPEEIEKFREIIETLGK
jgi:transcriptional regulator with XRE-family HTH domain